MIKEAGREPCISLDSCSVSLQVQTRNKNGFGIMLYLNKLPFFHKCQKRVSLSD